MFILRVLSKKCECFPIKNSLYLYIHYSESSRGVMPSFAFCERPGFLVLILLRCTFVVQHCIPCSRLHLNKFVRRWFQEVTCVHIHFEQALSTSSLETEDDIRDCDACGCLTMTFCLAILYPLLPLLKLLKTRGPLCPPVRSSRCWLPALPMVMACRDS